MTFKFNYAPETWLSRLASYPARGMPRLHLSLLALWLCACSGLPAEASSALDPYLADPKLTLTTWARDLGAARQLAIASNGDVFVNHGKISVLWDADGDGVSGPQERALFAQAPSLNHGLAFDRAQRFLYASSDSTVYRFAYRKGQRTAAGAGEVVVRNIPGAGHSTRTLVFDSAGRLYVSVGSAGNVDTREPDLRMRSQIRRFAIPEALPSGGIAYERGEVVARGMRNEVGLFMLPDDKLWGVENGRDNLGDADFGGDIHTDNPGEELNLIDPARAAFYGYPKCWSELKLARGRGAGTQWADESVPDELKQSDAYCQDPAQVQPPAYVLPAHWAPLGVLQYAGSLLPYRGDLLIGAHGSWNRSPATGRLVARARVQDGKVVSVSPLIAERAGKGYREGEWGVRPVDVREAADGSVLVSDDMGGRILRIGYKP